MKMEKELSDLVVENKLEEFKEQLQEINDFSDRDYVKIVRKCIYHNRSKFLLHILKLKEFKNVDDDFLSYPIMSNNNRIVRILLNYANINTEIIGSISMETAIAYGNKEAEKLLNLQIEDSTTVVNSYFIPIMNKTHILHVRKNTNENQIRRCLENAIGDGRCIDIHPTGDNNVFEVETHLAPEISVRMGMNIVREVCSLVNWKELMNIIHSIGDNYKSLKHMVGTRSFAKMMNKADKEDIIMILYQSLIKNIFDEIHGSEYMKKEYVTKEDITFLTKHAIEYGREKAFVYMITNDKFDVNDAQNEGLLLECVINNRPKLLYLLLKKGLDAKCNDNEAYLRAIALKNIECADLLDDCKVDNPIKDALMLGHLTTANIMIQGMTMSSMGGAASAASLPKETND